MDPVTMWNVKDVSCSDKHTENYHPTAVYYSSASYFSMLLLGLVCWPVASLSLLSPTSLPEVAAVQC